jgi:hypothetical protein
VLRREERRASAAADSRCDVDGSSPADGCTHRSKSSHAVCAVPGWALSAVDGFTSAKVAASAPTPASAAAGSMEAMIRLVVDRLIRSPQPLAQAVGHLLPGSCRQVGRADQRPGRSERVGQFGLIKNLQAD